MKERLTHAESPQWRPRGDPGCTGIAGCRDTRTKGSTSDILGNSTITHSGESKKKKLYTACNIWVHKYMKCINYKMGDFIPAGTEVSHVKVKYSEQDFNHFIYFKKAGSKKKYRMGFNTMWHRGKSIKDYKNYLFTEKTFDDLSKDMSETEIDAIKQGKIVVGMSKKAVLVSYGRPPEHRTPDLEKDEWRYWMDKRKQKKLCFHNGLTIRCAEKRKLSDEL